MRRRSPPGRAARCAGGMPPAGAESPSPRAMCRCRIRLRVHRPATCGLAVNAVSRRCAQPRTAAPSCGLPASSSHVSRSPARERRGASVLVSCPTSSRSRPLSKQTRQRKILVAPAWPYASGKRHLGHVVGFAVPADIFARYHRLKGNDVLMVSGTDEHGTPVMVTADREGVSPREIAERYNELTREDLRDLGISYDCFTRTTTQNHAAVTRDIFRTLYEHGCLIEQTTLGAFSATTGNTLPDRYIEGTCPICGFPEARGDQCDNCGNQLDPADLINPHSIIDGSTPEFRETTHLFLDLPKFADRLRPWIEQKKSWRPNVRNFSLSLVDNLKPRAMTRDIDWGIPVPVEGYPEETKRIYVWFDAVIGYLSAAVECAQNRDAPEAWRDWWQSPEALHAYFMGKDNIVFHTVIWPGMLLGYEGGGRLGAGKAELHLPDDVAPS